MSYAPRNASRLVLIFTGALAVAFGAAGIYAAFFDRPPECVRPGPDTEGRKTFEAAPCRVIDLGNVYYARIQTTKGPITLLLDPRVAPNTVNNFVFLARQGFYDGTAFHRVVDVRDQDPEKDHAYVMAGDPTGTGRGGPGYAFTGETPSPITRYVAGTVAMAHPQGTGPEKNGSQFFIVVRDWRALGTPNTVPKYSLLGFIAGPESVETLRRILAVPTEDFRPLEEVLILDVDIVEEPRVPETRSPTPAAPTPTTSGGPAPTPSQTPTGAGEDAETGGTGGDGPPAH